MITDYLGTVQGVRLYKDTRQLSVALSPAFEQSGNAAENGVVVVAYGPKAMFFAKKLEGHFGLVAVRFISKVKVKDDTFYQYNVLLDLKVLYR